MPASGLPQQKKVIVQNWLTAIEDSTVYKGLLLWRLSRSWWLLALALPMLLSPNLILPDNNSGLSNTNAVRHRKSLMTLLFPYPEMIQTRDVDFRNQHLTM